MTICLSNQPSKIASVPMRKPSAKMSLQGGQAIAEFLVCGAVLIPLFFGIYYTAKYADVKQSAIQASRYAAFERAWDPLSQVKSDAVLQQETRARFFTSIDRNGGQLRFDDGAAPLAQSSNVVALWRDARSNALINNYQSIAVRTASSNVTLGGAVGTVEQLIGGTVFGLPKSQMVVSQVDVPLLNIAHFEPLRNINIRIAGQTAVAGGASNASGPRNVGGTVGAGASVCERVTRTVPTSYLQGINGLLGTLMSPMERNSPQFGLVRPDIVPQGSIRSGTQDKSGC